MRTKLFLSLIFCIALLSCADTPTQPNTLTEEEIEALVDARVAEEIAKMTIDDALTPQEIRQIALDAIASVDKTPVEIAENALQSTSAIPSRLSMSFSGATKNSGRKTLHSTMTHSCSTHGNTSTRFWTRSLSAN